MNSCYNRRFHWHVSFETLLGLAAHHEPASYWDIVKRDNPRKSGQKLSPTPDPSQDRAGAPTTYRGTVSDVRFYTIADQSYFFGLVAMVNSLRFHGHRDPVTVLDLG